MIEALVENEAKLLARLKLDVHDLLVSIFLDLDVFNLEPSFSDDPLRGGRPVFLIDAEAFDFKVVSFCSFVLE